MKRVQVMQTNHMGLKWNFSDISHNFIIGGDGNVYEGRGWKNQVPHKLSNKADCIQVAFIGDFTRVVPNKALLDAGFQFFTNGVKSKMLREDYKIYGASQLRSTPSPGAQFMNVIKTWPQWAGEVNVTKQVEDIK
jgi:hypothetical protein